MSEESTVGGVKTDCIEKENADDNDVLVKPVTVIYALLTGEGIVVYEHVIVLAVLVIAEHVGVVINVLLPYKSFVHVNGKSKTILLLDPIWFLGVKLTTNLDRVKIVAP